MIGRTGRGNYGHGLDPALFDQPKLRLVAAAQRLGVDKTYADYLKMFNDASPWFVVAAPHWID